MPLRLVNKDRTYPIEVCGSTIHVISMSISEKTALIDGIQHISGDDNDAFDKLLDLIAPAITKIDSMKEPTRDILVQLEDFDELRSIVHAIIEHCSITIEEAKNSDSSSEQHTPDSAGSAEKHVVPENEHVSETPIPTD